MKVRRFFLEFKKSAYNGDNLVIPSNIKIFLEKNKDININKFFYKQIGKDHFWRDRLLWTDEEWNSYVNNKNLETWVMKIDGNLVGFYEQEFHSSKNEIELIQMGVLKEYQGKSLGNFLLKHAIYKSFNTSAKRVWVHTCTLDHKNAYKNYISRGFRVFKEEEIDFVA